MKMADMPDTVTLALPGWLDTHTQDGELRLAGREERMRWVIGLAERNVAERTGGPFAAAVFERADGRLVAAGVNRVVAARNPVAHAEVLALALACARVGSHDLGAPELPQHELVCTCEPCLMCLGAVLWSGVRSLVCAARGEDAQAIGFDEGPRPPDWVDALQRRGVQVVREVHREDAVALLRAYAARGGEIYNSRRPPPIDP
jgi:tRNA(Arg) A34 adenosine deaminase TadA